MSKKFNSLEIIFIIGFELMDQKICSKELKQIFFVIS